MTMKNYTFSTQRLLVGEWHSMTSKDTTETELPETVISILTPPVTRSLPTAWQGTYTLDRARAWIRDRDQEGVIMLIKDRLADLSIGFLILSEDDNRDVRIGYLLAEHAWGKGLASELIQGFIVWCKDAGLRSIVGGVARDNEASIRVLEKNGFVCEQAEDDTSEIFCTLLLETGPLR
jgi:RimJ/RimL family protein N-acetyltransferase